MVVKIHKSRESMNGTLTYNESKVRKGVASIIGFEGMENPEPAFARMVFGLLERRNIRTENVSFQMSINPNPDEPEEYLTDQEACDYTKDIMESLGYGNQPYIIYKHSDIDRIHYHVVSCRVNLQGKKIKDKFEKKRMEKLILRLADKYHYTVGNPKKKNEKKQQSDVEQPLLDNKITDIETVPVEPVPIEPIWDNDIINMDEISPIGTVAQQNTADKQNNQKENKPITRFDPKGKNVKKQYIKILDEAMTYRFATLYQFTAICESLGVTVSNFSDKKGRRLSFQGLDENGNIIKAPCNEKDLGRNFYKEIETILQKYSSKEQKADLKSSSKSDRTRIGRMANFALSVSKSQNHFEKILQKKGIYIGFSFNVKNELFGITLVDSATKTAYKASDLLPPLNMNAVQEKAEKWLTEKEIYTNRQKLREQASRDEFLESIDKSITIEDKKLTVRTWIEILYETFNSTDTGHMGKTFRTRNIYKKNIFK